MSAAAAAAAEKTMKMNFGIVVAAAMGTTKFLSVECSSHIQCVAVQRKDADDVDEHLGFSHFLFSFTSSMSKYYLSIEKRKVS